MTGDMNEKEAVAAMKDVTDALVDSDGPGRASGYKAGEHASARRTFGAWEILGFPGTLRPRRRRIRESMRLLQRTLRQSVGDPNARRAPPMFTPSG